MTPEKLEQVGDFRAVVYPMIDKWCQAAVETFGSGCRAGCDICCHFVVTCSFLEALVMVRNPAGLKLIEGNRRCVVDTANLFLRRDPVTRCGEWAKRGEPCVFLVDGRCAVYEDRPFNCRTHLAPTPCTREQEGNGYVDTREITRAGVLASEEASREFGLPGSFGPMPVMLLIAEAFLKAEQEKVEEAYRGTPFLSTEGSLRYWAYVEL